MIDLFASNETLIGTIYQFLYTVGLTPDSVVSAFRGASVQFSQAIVGAAPILLSTTLAIRLIANVIKELLDGDLGDVISEAVFTALMGIILAALLVWWNGAPDGGLSIRAVSEGFYNQLVALMPGVGTADTLVGQMFLRAGEIIHTMHAEATHLSGRAFEQVIHASAWWSGLAGLFGGIVNILLLVVAWVFYGLAAIGVALLACVLVFYMLAGLIMVQVALAFGPLTLAAYPLIDTWAKTVVKTIASGTAQALAGFLLMGVVANLLSLIVGGINGIIPGSPPTAP